MTLDLELLAVRRAQEQLDEGSWRHRDRDEPTVVPEVRRCPVCDAVIPPRGRNKGMTGRICHDCSVKGWRPAPCASCGGPTRTTDRNNQLKRQGMWGVCGKCRAEIRRNTGHGSEEAA